MGNVLITADSPCDLGESLQSRYQLHYYPYHIILDGKEYTDGGTSPPTTFSRPIGNGNSSRRPPPSASASTWTSCAP